jgi:hypothetical protein
MLYRRHPAGVFACGSTGFSLCSFVRGTAKLFSIAPYAMNPGCALFLSKSQNQI